MTIQGIPRVALLLATGYEELEAVTVVDIMRRSQIVCDIVAVSHDLIVPSARDVKIVADIMIDDAVSNQYDMIVLPGGIDGTENLANDKRVVELLKRQLKRGAKIGAICAAPTVLERHGMADGKSITCHPVAREAIKNAHLKDEPVVKDGLLITSQGPGTALKFALDIVEELLGKEKKEELKKALLA